nr:uncharacterized protein LOC110383656 isoform X1 [Helicoverpa armigera]XP_049703834.1 uncharacterized protein LOC110383656 isoform X2 [Helicoverpa armigera]XP_049703835.1 uncharacterized protein LOC110383656 isoform X3 [Helicoverpa armigera]XP_049703836.1 uncharacterized protein LOC110383656 isoform X4 [Helicoverpa armigera]
MNVLYTSQKLQELFCDEDLSLPANNMAASGDGDGAPGRCCRLCGGDSNLRYFGDTYIWEGVEERYDQLLYDCFGVKVTPSDCMICEWCVRALRSTERFRALVHAAFEQPNSDVSSNSTTLKSNSCINNDSKASPKPEKEVPSKKPFDLAKRREARKRIQVNDAKAKRINIHCEVCKQRYPMLVANDGNKSFICSRCKKNGELKGAVCRKCNIVMPNSMMKDHLDLHAKADMRGKFRTQQPKKTHLTLVNSVTKQKSQRYQCTRCPKKYALARNLALHVRNSHGDSVDDMCSGCGEDLSQTEQSQHPLHQCSERVPVKANVRAANPLKSS